MHFICCSALSHISLPNFAAYHIWIYVCIHQHCPANEKKKKKLLATCAAFLTQKTGVLAEVFPDTANKIHNDYTPDFIATILFTVSCRAHL